MKPLPILLLTFALCAAFLLPGCAGLFGPSVEKAQEIAEARQDEFDKAVGNFLKAEKDLNEVAAQLDQAIRDNDATAIEKLRTAVQAASAKYESAKNAAKSAESLFNAAVQDFKDAKSASDYVGTVLGWLSMGLNAVLGTGAAGALVGRARAREAVKGVTGALEKTKADPAKWPEARTSMQASLSTGALKIIDKLRP